MGSHNALTDERAREALAAIVSRVETTLSAVGDEFPSFADPERGVWETTTQPDWCAGHWIGLLRLAAEHTDDPASSQRFESAATDYTDRLVADQERFTESLFAAMNFLYAGFRAYDQTGDRRLYGLGFAGADAVRDLYHECARQIVSGRFTLAGPKPRADEEIDYDDEEWTTSGDAASAVDSCYVAVPALWRAYRESGDPTFRDVAVSHTDRYLDRFVRENGSTRQRIQFDPETGDEVSEHYDLGHSQETCWARGHGWCVAGLARAYRETGAERYREALERTVGYYRESTPDDLVPYWDFEAPGIPDEPRDTSAAALVAYGLSRLDEDDERVEELRETGLAVLDSIVENYLVSDPEDPRFGMVQHGCYNRPADYAVDNELIWTDYYVAFALDSLL